MHVKMQNPAVESAREVLLALLDSGPVAGLEPDQRAVLEAIVTAPLSYVPLMRATGRKVGSTSRAH